jgi:hypothetical protein
MAEMLYLDLVLYQRLIEHIIHIVKGLVWFITGFQGLKSHCFVPVGHRKDQRHASSFKIMIFILDMHVSTRNNNNFVLKPLILAYLTFPRAYH